MADEVILRLGHSPDPDDAFMWWPLGTAGLEGGPAGAPAWEPSIDTGRYVFRPVAADIQALNERAIGGGDLLEITAVSMHAYGRVRDRYVLTDCGASFGEGYGPKVLVRGGSGGAGVEWLRGMLGAGGTIAVPGFETSAYLVLRLMLGDAGEAVLERGGFVVRPFDEVVPAVLGGEVDAGLVIHEAQVTYAEEGMDLAVDLGVWWGEETGLPMPLGANVVRRDLDERHGAGTCAGVAGLLRESVEYAMRERGKGLGYAELFARAGGAGGIGAAAVDEFVGLYVNDLTRSMGDRGRRAVEELLGRGEAAGLVPTGGAVEVVG